LDDDTMWGNIFRNTTKQEDNIYTVLSKIPLFSDLNKKELKSIERIMHHRTYNPDETVFHEGDPGVGMYIIVTGHINISFGKEGKLLAVLSNGEFFGEIALLLKQICLVSFSQICLVCSKRIHERGIKSCIVWPK